MIFSERENNNIFPGLLFTRQTATRYIIFYRRAFVKAIGLSLALATVQRISGAGAIIQFTAKLFKISGSSVEPITASIITGVFQLVGSAVAIGLVDRVGRRKLLLISSTVVVQCLIMLTLYFYYLNKGNVT